jgi:chaperone modulatory protein CbpM
MVNEVIKLLSGVIVEDQQTISLAELCHCCSLPAEQVIAMIEYGIIEPLEPRDTISHWQFAGNSILRVQTAIRLQRDLDVNLAGAVLALELLDEVKALRQLTASLQRR